MPPEILWLGDPACHDRELVGGKAAQLSRLAATHRVPPGFCLTPAVDFDGLRIGAPAALLQQVASAYLRLEEQSGVTEPPLAVRSSAVDEDGARFSFAGVNETFLNVAGLRALADAAVACWQSGTSERARSYRQQMGLPGHPRVAVLVQQLVPAEASAVAFSVNPITGSREEMIINANWGLGESVVGGTVTPDMFTVGKQDLRLRERLIGDKARMTSLAPNGTAEVDTPRSLRSQPALNDGQVEEIAVLVRGLEQQMGWPVDVECAYHGGFLYLLQCRPVTSLPL